MEINNTTNIDYQNNDIYYSVHPYDCHSCWEGEVFIYDKDNDCWNEVYHHIRKNGDNYIFNHIDMISLLKKEYKNYVLTEAKFLLIQSKN